MKSMTDMEIIEKYYGTVPIDLYSLVSDLGLKIEYIEERNFPDILKAKNYTSGYLKYSKSDNQEQFIICVNPKHPPFRKRFTIAHEIGHYIKHKDLLTNHTIFNGNADEISNIEILIARSNVFSSQEREANEFAATILMPRMVLMAKFAKKEVTSLKQVANYFQVSEQAMEIRLKSLGLTI